MGFFRSKKKESRPNDVTESHSGNAVSIDTALTKTKTSFFSRLSKSLFGKSAFDDDDFDELEEALLLSDVGIDTANKLIERLKKKDRQHTFKEFSELKAALKEEIIALFDGKNFSASKLDSTNGLWSILVVGVNGVGKTTTIGKLAGLFATTGKKVVIGAGDTYRAAAIEQIERWATRANVRLIAQKRNADPASVAYDTIASALSKNEDVAILDTAGRLHNKTGLMQELARIKKVVQKLDPQAPNEVLLVLDATTGQNAIEQCKQFSEFAGVTGVVVTKLDGTAKGGVIIGICDKFNIPVKYVCTGENMTDIQAFDYNIFVDNLFKE